MSARACIAAVAVAACALPAPAAALSLPGLWTPPQAVEGTGGATRGVPGLAFAPDGTGIVSTTRDDCRPGTSHCRETPLVVRVRDGAPEAAQELRGAPAGVRRVRPYGAGRLVGVGLDGRRVVAAFGTPERGLGRARRVGTHTRGFWSWTANARGAVAVVFVDRQGVKLAYRPAGRSFRRPVLIDRVRNATYAPRAALNERGDVLVAWSDDHPARAIRTDAVHARVVTAGGRRGRTRRLGPTCDLWQGDVALAPGRRALVAWHDECGNEASVAYAPRGGGFLRRQMLERLGRATTFTPREIRAAFTAGGGALVAWRGGSDAEPAVRVADLAGERFREPQTLERGELRPWYVTLTVGPRGEALVAWQEGDADSGPRSVVAAARPAGASAFGGREVVATAQSSAGPPVVGVDPATSRALAFWTDGDDGLLHSRRHPIE